MRGGEESGLRFLSNGLLEDEERMIGMVFCLACIEVLARMKDFTLGSSPCF